MAAVDFIHPIIQAYTAGRQHALERARLLQEQSQFGERQKLEEERLKQEHQEKEETLAQAQDLATKARELQKMQLDMEDKRNKFQQSIQSIDQLHKVASGELKEVPTGPNGEPPEGAIQIPGLENTGKYYAANDPAAILARIQAESLAKSSGEAQGQLPTRLQEIQATGEQARQTQAGSQSFEASQKSLDRAQAEKLAQLNRGTQVQIENSRLGMEQERNELEFGGTPESRRAMIMDFGSGMAKPNIANPREMNALSAMQANGMKPVDPKQIEALKQMENVSPALDQMQDFTKYLPSEKDSGSIGAKVAAMAQKAGVSSPWPSDVKNKFQDVVGQLTNVGKAIEGLPGGRLLSKQFETEYGSIGAPGQTQEQALGHVQNLRNLLTKSKETVLGGIGPEQRSLIQQQHGLSIPNAKYEKTFVGPNGHQIGTNDGKQWFDVPTGSPTVPQQVQQ